MPFRHTSTPGVIGSPSAAEPLAGRTAAAALNLPAAQALMLASGFAALACQIIWTQMTAIWLGHETTAVLAVVGAFFAGLAVGAFSLGRRVETSAQPERWYAACELVIGAWGLALVFLIAPAGQVLLALTGEQPTAAWQWSLAFVGTFLLLLPATAAMGATLPALERVLARRSASGTALAGLYAANTFGAVLGVLASAFWLVPTFGLASTAMACAALNLLCGAATLWLFRGPAAITPPTPLITRAPGLVPRLALTGLLGIGYEVLVVRVLRQMAENTVYTFAMLLAVYLVGTALGAAAYQRWLARCAQISALGEKLLLALAIACLLGTTSLWMAEELKAAVLQVAGNGLVAALAAEATLAAVAFLLPTVVMGALFSHLCTLALASGLGFGRALAVNTLGAAAAPFLFGVLIAPMAGPKAALLLVVTGYLLLALRLPRLSIPVVATAAATFALAWLAPPLAFVEVPEGGRIVSYRDGALGAVSVVEDADGVARLRIDNRQQEGSSATLYADARQALLPLLLHPAPRRALFLGLGTGVTASAAAQDTQLQVDAVELLPEVISASQHFTRDLNDGVPNPRLHVITGDARRFVRATPRHYDLIVADNFHPARSGSASLYTVEHFRAVRARLAPGGVFCQWLPLHQLDLPTLRSIVRAFVDAEPQAWAMLSTFSLETPVLGLVTRADAGPFDRAQLQARLQGARLTRPLPAFGLSDELALWGGFVAGPASLARFAAGATTNSDDHPVVAYRAPRITYAPDSLPRERLLALLGELDVTPQEVMSNHPADGAWPARLAAYWRARDRFLLAGRDVRPSDNVQRMLAQVREPLLEVMRISPEFRPAYDPLLQMAVALGRTDAPGARALLAELARLQPARAEGPRALQALEEVRP
jgi:spermidine synthase